MKKVFYENESPLTSHLPNGYYLISTEEGTDSCLVYLYDHSDFDGVRHFAYGMQDGGVFISVNDELVEGTQLTPVTIARTLGNPSTTESLDNIIAMKYKE
jgi:hypothetical protein